MRAVAPVWEGSPMSEGGPKAPGIPEEARVSRRRQGGMATKASGDAVEVAASACVSGFTSERGDQYVGTFQSFNGGFRG